MKLKTVSKLLAATLFLTNINIYSLAGTLSEDGRYESFEGNSITIDDILEEDEVDVEIEGNTLVNHSHIKSYTAGDAVSYNLNTRMVPGKTYTFYCKVTEVSNDNPAGPFMRVHYSSNPGDYINIIDEEYKIGEYIKTFTIPDDKEVKSYYFGWIRNHQEGQYAIMDDIIVLEGEYTLDTIPKYFKGMKSVGQDDVNSDKIEILAENKNLFNKNNVNKLSYMWQGSKSSENAGKGVISTDYYESIYWIKIKPSTTYTIQKTISYRNRVAFSEKEPALGVETRAITNLGTYADTSFPMTVTSLSNENYLLISGHCFDIGTIADTITEEELLDSIQIEEATQATSYEEHSLNKTEIPLSEPLRSLPNGVKDRVVKINNQWFIERNCGEIMLNGDNNEEWIFESDWTGNSDELSRFHIFIPNQKYILWRDLMYESKNYSINNRFNTLENLVKTHALGVEHFSGWDLGKFVLNIKTSRLSIENESGLKQWLSENPIEVVYELETPIYESLNIGPTINLYSDTTHIHNSSIIPVNMKLTFNRTANRAKEAIETAKLNPTSENIAKARMWTNMLKESTLKDNFQDTISEITEVVDLTIDKKKVSANLDVYIKSANSLTMSLSTNSITFENYSGVESMEKLNAVNITVNSSLPYELNAYMPTPMSSSDGKTMAMNVVNIKDNSESNYSQFVNTTDKVVLKGDCSAGDNNIHNIDLKLSGGNLHEADVYRTVLKFEAVQK